MNFKDKSDYTAFAKAMFWCIVLSSAVVLCMVNAVEFVEWIKDILSSIAPIIIAFALAYVLNRPYSAMLRIFEERVFKRKCGFATLSALAVVYLAAFGALTLLFIYIIPAFIQSAEDFAGALPKYYGQVRNFIASITGAFGISSQTLEQFMFDSSEMLDRLVDMLVDYREQIFTFSVQIVRSAVNVVTGVIASAYMLGSKPRIIRRLKIIMESILTADDTRKNAYQLFNEANRAFSGYILGRLIDAAIIGVVCYIAFIVFNLPYPILLAVICGVTNFVPVFGPLIGAIMAGAIVFIVSPDALLRFLIIVAIVQAFDGNLIGPKLLGKTMGMATVWVVISITTLGGLFGFWGMVLGVPLFGVAYSLFNMLVKMHNDKKRAKIMGIDEEN